MALEEGPLGGGRSVAPNAPDNGGAISAQLYPPAAEFWPLGHVLQSAACSNHLSVENV